MMLAVLLDGSDSGITTVKPGRALSVTSERTQRDFRFKIKPTANTKYTVQSNYRQ